MGANTVLDLNRGKGKQCQEDTSISFPTLPGLCVATRQAMYLKIKQNKQKSVLKREGGRGDSKSCALQMETQLEVKGKNDKELYELEL